MLFSQNLKFSLYILCSLPLFACAPNLVVEDQLLKQDAKIFCDLHKTENLTEIPSEATTDEASSIIYHRGIQSLKTVEVRMLLEEMNTVRFYRQMYPLAKEKIEKITGDVWNCPAYKNFYQIKLADNNSDSNPIDIIITKNGEYLIQNQPVELTSKAIDSALNMDTNKIPQYKLIIQLQDGASDELLEPLFKILTSLGFETVNVLSDE